MQHPNCLNDYSIEHKTVAKCSSFLFSCSDDIYQINEFVYLIRDFCFHLHNAHKNWYRFWFALRSLWFNVVSYQLLQKNCIYSGARRILMEQEKGSKNKYAIFMHVFWIKFEIRIWISNENGIPSSQLVIHYNVNDFQKKKKEFQ